MKPESWKQLDQLFHEALALPPDECDAFLNDACAGDDSLRHQVEALLSAHGKAGSFIEKPALEVEARFIAKDQTESTVGQTIGHYKIISQLGVGGMGEVYLAEDTTLGRKVAIKLLPADFTHDDDRVRRFQQEARAASALNHPNIITIFEIGEVENRHFIATEFIDGHTLRQHIGGSQSNSVGEESLTLEKLKLEEILSISIQIADALAAAHEVGIVHRDIKPENIMVRRRDSYVKVLDFGLAKLTDAANASIDPEGPTRAQVRTSVGIVMGTPSYMSPEQTRGATIDARTDVWSLGVVIYELIAGCPPFKRPTSSEVIALILEREPPPLALYARNVPVELERIVSKALTKDKEERYQTAKDLLVDLRRLKQRIDVEAEIDRNSQPREVQELRSDSVPARIVTAEQQTNATVIDVQKTTAAPATTSSIARIGKTARSRTGVILLGTLILAGAAGWFIWRRANVKWAEAQVPKIEALAQAQKFYEAYELAVPAQKYLPQDATITRLMPIISNTISVKTDPAGAQVYLRRFVPDDAGKSASRQLVGTTPLENLRVARAQLHSLH